MTSSPPRKLNIGSGPGVLEGFINLDGLDLPGVDVQTDLGQPLPFADGSIDLIYASHVLEHFATDVVPTVLRDWRRILVQGGILLVAVPDLEVIARQLVERTPGWFTPPHNPWLGAIYGGQKDHLDFHKTGFTAPWLTGLLSDAGFGALERVDRFHEVRAADASFSPLPFGRNVSLNMRAVAGGSPISRDLLQPTRAERTFDYLDRAILAQLRTSARARASLIYRRRKRLERAIEASEGPR